VPGAGASLAGTLRVELLGAPQQTGGPVEVDGDGTVCETWGLREVGTPRLPGTAVV
jgi:hypothetical protein